MNACIHLGKPECVQYPRRPSPGICTRVCKFYSPGSEPMQASVKGRAAPYTLPAPIPREKWGPGLMEWIAQGEANEKGLGSTLRRIGTAEAKVLLIQLTPGVPCAWRVAACDALYPY